MIFRRRRTRIEIVEHTLTVGVAQTSSAAQAATEPKITEPQHNTALLLPSPAVERNPPSVAGGESTPEGTRHDR